jgi:hypothetical protein
MAVGGGSWQRRAGAATVVALAWVGAPAAHAGWSAPETIAGPVATVFLDQPTVVAGPHGRFTAAWTQGDGIGMATSRASTRFGPPVLVPDSAGGYASAVGLDPRGNATIAWIRDFDCSDDEVEETCGEIRAVGRRRAGRFTRTRTLTSRPHDTFFPRISVAADGRAAVFWGGLGNDGAGARVAKRLGAFGPAEFRDRDIATWTWRGGAAEVVLRKNGSLVAVRRRADRGLDHRRVIASDRGRGFYPYDVGVDRRGLRSVVWSGSSSRGGSLLVAQRTRSGKLGPTQTLATDPGQSYLYGDIDSGGSGLSVAAWSIRGTRPQALPTYSDAPAEAEVRAAVSLPGHPFGRSQVLAPRETERPVYGIVAAAAGDRSAVVAWVGTDADGAQVMYASRAGGGGNFGTPRVLSGDATDTMSSPAIAIDRRGDAVVVWLEGLQVRAARFRSAAR